MSRRFPPARPPHARLLLLLLIVSAGSVAACANDADDDDARPPALPPGMMPPPTTNADATPPAVPFSPATPRVHARAAGSWPHDPEAYTQGLLVHDGRLLEGTGLEGHSELREVDVASGRARRRTPTPSGRFCEGLAVLGDRIYQLTWLAKRGHVYDLATLQPVDSFTYEGEGWGLAADGRLLYMSDGTSRIRVVDPKHGFQVQRTIQVTEGGTPVHALNELEWVRGELWANVYRTDYVARIDPTSGHVVGWLDLGGLLSPEERRAVEGRGGVANGIAFDSARNRVLVTGKYWPRLFQLDPPPIAASERRGSQRPDPSTPRAAANPANVAASESSTLATAYDAARQ